MKKRLLCLLLTLLLAIPVPAAAEGETQTEPSQTTTETTELSDGSTMTVVTDNQTGAAVTSIVREDGTLFQFQTSKRGKLLDALVDVSLKAARHSAETGETIYVPLRSVIKRPEEQNLRFRVDIPRSVKEVWLEFPVEETLPGAVAVTVDENDKQTVIRQSYLWDDCLVFPLDKDATVMLVDNSRTFADVQEADHWAAEAVEFTVARELFQGVDDTHFDPDGTLTRAMVVTVLWRLIGAPRVDHAMTFIDVSPGTYYMDAVGWAFAQKLVSGYDAQTFAPNDIITREQLAVILWRFAEKPGSPGAMLDFADADEASEYAIPALLWAAGEEYLEPVDGLLQPRAPATRAQTAQLLMNFLCW